MQCGTEAEIKDRHRQTERWVVGGCIERWWVVLVVVVEVVLVVVVVVEGGIQRQTEEERGRDGEREVRKGGSHFSSTEHPFLHIIISSPALLRHSLDPKKNRQLNYHTVQICMPVPEH